jgi:hypothetical protein
VPVSKESKNRNNKPRRSEASNEPSAFSWRAWLTPGTIIALAGGVIYLAYTLNYRLPDLEKKVREDGQASEKRLVDWQSRVTDRLSRIETLLLSVRTNLLRVCVRNKQAGKECKLEELVAAAKEVSHLQAQYLAGAKLESLSGSQPQVSIPELADQITIQSGSFASASESVRDKTAIASLVAWTSAADAAKWTASKNQITVQFANGKAVFEMEPQLSKASVVSLVDSLNGTSEAIHASVVKLSN